MGFAWRTAWKDLLRRLRDPVGMLLWLGAPLLVLLLVHLALPAPGSAPRIAVLLAGDTALPPPLPSAPAVLEAPLRGAAELGAFDVELVEVERGRARMDAGDAVALVVVPPGFAEALLREEPATLQLVVDPTRSLLAHAVEDALRFGLETSFYAHRILGDPLGLLADARPPAGSRVLPDEDVARVAVAMNRAVRQLEQVFDPPLVELASSGTALPETSGLTLLFLPAMLFLSLGFLAGSCGNDIWLEKTRGTLRRALAAPRSVAAFLAGKILAASVLAAAVGGVLMAVARGALGIPIAHPLLALAWLAVSGGLFALLVLPLSMRASNERTAELVVNLVLLPVLMLGGSFFPFELMPGWMATLGRLTPNGWALSRFREIVAGELDVATLALSLAAVAAVCALLFRALVRRTAAFARQA